MGIETKLQQCAVDVVVIGLNEAENLPRCFQSVDKAFRAAGKVVGPGTRIFVDAGSHDASVEVAKEYADLISVARGRVPAAAARNAGLRLVKNNIVLFLDGDMELDEGWLRSAVPMLQRMPSAMGIVGRRDDVYVSGGAEAVRVDVYKVGKRTRKAPHFGGALLAKSCSIRSVGGYRERLRSSEEPDLYARMLQFGGFVLEIPEPFVRHYTARPSRSWSRIWKSSRSFGDSFVSAIAGNYLRGFVQVFPATVGTWIVDLCSLLLIAAHAPDAAMLLQAALLIVLAVLRRPKVFVTARARFLGTLLATGARLRRTKRSGPSPYTFDTVP